MGFLGAYQTIDKVVGNTYGGRVYIDWDHEAPVTSLGQLSFFIEFLKRTELFDQGNSTMLLPIKSESY